MLLFLLVAYVHCGINLVMTDMAAPAIYRSAYTRSPKITLLVACLWPMLALRRSLWSLKALKGREAIGIILLPASIVSANYVTYHYEIERQDFTFLTAILFISLVPVVHIFIQLGRGAVVGLFGSKEQKLSISRDLAHNRGLDGWIR